MEAARVDAEAFGWRQSKGKLGTPVRKLLELGLLPEN
jgi:hypothetical protein